MNLEDARFYVLDTETTSADPEEAEIVELSIRPVVNTSAGWEKDLFTPVNSLAEPGVPIPAVASAVHHITDEDVRGMPSPGWLLDDMEWGEESRTVLVAHNAAYDRAVIERVAILNLPWLCTFRLARHLLPEAPSHSNQALRYWLGLDVPEAKGLAAHRAMADAEVTASLLIYLLGLDHGCRTVEELIALAESPVELRTVPFGKHAGKGWGAVPSDYLSWMLRQDFDSDLMYTARRQLDRRASAI